jgi:hypothetical protein
MLEIKLNDNKDWEVIDPFAYERCPDADMLLRFPKGSQYAEKIYECICAGILNYEDIARRTDLPTWVISKLFNCEGATESYADLQKEYRTAQI